MTGNVSAARLTEAEREGLIEAVQDGNEVEYVEALIASRLSRAEAAIRRGPWGPGMPNGMHREAIEACARIVERIGTPTSPDTCDCDGDAKTGHDYGCPALLTPERISS